MIKINEVLIKQKKNGDDYKLLKLQDGKAVSMWGDDSDYDSAIKGADLDREIQKDGQYWNLLPSGETPTVKPQPNVTNGNLEELNKKIGAVYAVVSQNHSIIRKIAESLKIELETPQVEYPENTFNPDDSPF
jgi:hypothetical protein